jgi:hypothetical protein
VKTVWLSCKGETAADVENVGPIQYFPRPGFPGYYFPYNNTENYMSPIVAVHFERPRRGKSIDLCWALLQGATLSQLEAETIFTVAGKKLCVPYLLEVTGKGPGGQQ